MCCAAAAARRSVDDMDFAIVSTLGISSLRSEIPACNSHPYGGARGLLRY